MFTIKYNRTTDHIEGLEIRTAGTETDYARSACPTLSRGTRLAAGKSSADLGEVLKSFGRTRKACRHCQAAAEAMA